MIIPEEMESIAFLRQLGQPHLERVARLARLEECEEGSVLFHEGDESPFLYFVLSGEVALEIEHPDGAPVEVCIAGPGEMLGWSAVLGRPVMTATARVLSRCRLASLEIGPLLKLCEQNPRFGMALYRQVGLFLSDRLASTRRCLAFTRKLRHLSRFALAHEGSD